MTTAPPVASGDAAMPRRSLLAWALRRALIGILIFVTAIGAFAWLFHSSIEAEEEAIAAVSPAAEARPVDALSFGAVRPPRL
jgi:hypothetical protein